MSAWLLGYFVFTMLCHKNAVALGKIRTSNYAVKEGRLFGKMTDLSGDRLVLVHAVSGRRAANIEIYSLFFPKKFPKNRRMPSEGIRNRKFRSKKKIIKKFFNLMNVYIPLTVININAKFI